MKKHYSIVFALFCWASVAAAQSTVDILVDRPATYGLLPDTKIAIGQIKTSTDVPENHLIEIGDEITAQLFATQRYEVVDREHLASILQEQKLTFAGMVDEQSASEVGKLIGPGVMLFTRVQTDQYSERTWEQGIFAPFSKEQIVKKFREGTHQLTLHIKVVDIQTAKVVFAKTVTGKASHKVHATGAAYTTKAPPLNQEALYMSARQKAVSSFIRLITPYQEMVRLRFKTHRHLPEVRQAVELFRINEWKDGMTLLRQKLNNQQLESSIKARLHYNLALVMIYSGRFEQAIELLREAMQLDPRTNDYNEAVILAKKERVLSERLLAQAGQPFATSE